MLGAVAPRAYSGAMPSPRTLHPASAMAWLLPEQGARALDLCGGHGAFTADLLHARHRVYALTSDARTASLVRDRAPGATVVRGDPARMPFRPRWFDVVTVAVDTPVLPAAYPEVVRVLRPGGYLALLRTTRDDTVPWVRRLAGLIHAHDPTAMTATAWGPSEDGLAASGWFVSTETRSFRLWVPVDRPTLQAMVERRQPVQALAERDRTNLLADVRMLFDDIARGHEVMLPYRVECLKAWPDPEMQSAEPSITVGIHLRW